MVEVATLTVMDVLEHVNPPETPEQPLSAKEWADRIHFLSGRLHQARETSALLALHVKTAREKWEADNRELLDMAAAFSAAVANEEEALRALAVDAYLATKDKHPGPGATVKDTKTLHYDRDEAFAWAKLHDLCLALDVRPFEQLALAGGVSVATVTIEPKCSISRDLGAELLGWEG